MLAISLSTHLNSYNHRCSINMTNMASLKFVKTSMVQEQSIPHTTDIDCFVGKEEIGLVKFKNKLDYGTMSYKTA